MEEMPVEEFIEWKWIDSRGGLPTQKQLFGMLAAAFVNFGGLSRPEKPVGWKDFWPDPKPIESQRDRDIKHGEALAAKKQKPQQKNDTDCAVWTT